MFRKLHNDKKTGVLLVLTGFALLLIGLVCIPFKNASDALACTLLGLGAALILAAIPVMWRDGIRAAKAKPRLYSHLHRMRQSGFFDIVVLALILAVVLALLGAIGLISYNATLASFARKAGAPENAALEELRLMETFNEYNFNHALNVLSSGYHTFFVIALILAVFVIVCALYMRFISPIVQADEQLQMAHACYRVTAQYAAAIFLVLVSLFPIYWMVISSFKTGDELLQSVPTLWPRKFIFENYPVVLSKAPFGRYLLNTLIVTLFVMAGDLTIGVMAAYGFSKGDFKGKNTLFLLVLGALMVPIQVTFVPIYVTISRMNLIDTWWGLILPSLCSAYFIFMLRQNFMAVDNSYIEAGKIDGMGRFGTIVNVLCPMCKPTLITVSIISFINGWNSYFWPKMVAKSDASRTIAVGVQRLKETYAGQYVANFNEIMAGAVMAIIPIVFLFLILQKYIMTGMSKAAMK